MLSSGLKVALLCRKWSHLILPIWLIKKKVLFLSRWNLLHNLFLLSISAVLFSQKYMKRLRGFQSLVLSRAEQLVHLLSLVIAVYFPTVLFTPKNRMNDWYKYAHICNCIYLFCTSVVDVQSFNSLVTHSIGVCNVEVVICVPFSRFAMDFTAPHLLFFYY